VAGGKKKRNRPVPSSATAVALNTTIHPDAATGQEVANERGTSLGLLGTDTTNAPPPLDEKEDASKLYAQTPAALADKHLLSKEPEFIFFGLLVLAILALAGIDDYYGRLNNGPGLIHFCWKCGMLTAIVLIMMGVYWMFRKLKRWLGT
jgi:hypothetical protein